MKHLLTTLSSHLAKPVATSIVVVMVFGMIFAPLSPIFASTPITISSIVVSKTDKTATISWVTNVPTTGKVEYGLKSNAYTWTVATQQRKTDHVVTIMGLNPDTNYYIRVTADDSIDRVVSFEQGFRTTKSGDDNISPKMTNVRVADLTNTTATIQWSTDELATSEVDYGLTEAYGSSKRDGKLVRIHEVTLSGLKDGTYYHFRAGSRDDQGNIIRGQDLTFRTQLTGVNENTTLTISDIRPQSANDSNITPTSVVISWHTNRITSATVKYGEKTSFNKSISTLDPKQYDQNVTISSLKPGTLYYYEIESRDVTGKTAKSGVRSFTTTNQGAVLGDKVYSNGYTTSATGGTNEVGTSCSINTASNSNLGFAGYYYNLTSAHPDFESWKQTVKVAGENDWYSSQYFSFSRVDQNLDFGINFFPFAEKSNGDKNLFAVKWRALMNVPENDTYDFKISSDDDSWIIIDGEVVSAMPGVHRATAKTTQVSLTKGLHVIEIYYADRQSSSAVMSFTPESRIKFHPLPEGCGLSNLNSGTPATPSTDGQVLGDKVVRGKYVCDPNLGYTRFTALYKTADEPDVWAILETGQRHYITSPAALAKYGCSWSEVQVVSHQKLYSYESAQLVRTIDNPSVYYLFQRPQTQWLKINMPSPTVFISYERNYWGNVARIDALDLNEYPDVKLVKKAGDSKVYVLDGENKHLITSAATFEARGYKWPEVSTINETHLNHYYISTPIN